MSSEQEHPMEGQQDAVMIPADKAARDALAKMAGLTDEERAAIDQWCFLEEQKRQRGILFHEGEQRGG